MHRALRDLPGSADAQRLMLARAVSYSQELEREAGDDPRIQSVLASVYERIGLLQAGPPESSSSLGDRNEALLNQQKALAIRQKLVTTYPFKTGYKRELGSSYVRIAELEHMADRPDLELENSRKAIETFNRSDSAAFEALASAYRSLAASLASQGDFKGALAAVRERVDLRRKIESYRPQDAIAQVATAEALGQQASVLEQQGDLAQALQLVKANTAVFERAARANPGNARFQTLVNENRRRAVKLSAGR
jgi:tetratricopeptide (TPR) repeat protein